MDVKVLKDYAKLIVKMGVNVQEGQEVCARCSCFS